MNTNQRCSPLFMFTCPLTPPYKRFRIRRFLNLSAARVRCNNNLSSYSPPCGVTRHQLLGRVSNCRLCASTLRSNLFEFAAQLGLALLMQTQTAFAPAHIEAVAKILQLANVGAFGLLAVGFSPSLLLPLAGTMTSADFSRQALLHGFEYIRSEAASVRPPRLRT